MMIASSSVRYLSASLVAFIFLILLVNIIRSDSSSDSLSQASKNKFQSLHDQYVNPQDAAGPLHPLGSELAVGGGHNNVKLEKGVFIVLARNSDVWDIIKSIRQVEDRFNKNYGYPYVFFNDVDFDETFMKHTAAVASSKCQYVTIPSYEWNQPDWIDEDKASKAREAMKEKNVIYAESVPYRNMCRFNSGFFWRHPILDDYEFYWRIEPSVDFLCDIDVDPFTVMREGDLNYGFTISLYEFQETMESLWDTVKAFIKQYPELIPANNAMKFLSDDGGETYNRCHFWSNFEIARLSFWRSEQYRTFFDFLDKTGGFYYERWGDAPIHSIAAALFSRPDQLHFFQDIGYRHTCFMHCPVGDTWTQKCYCNPNDNFDRDGYSCLTKFEDMAGIKFS